MKMKSVFIPVPVEEHKPATNPATNNGIVERSADVIFYDETLGWKVGWRKLFTANSSDPLFPEQVKGYSIFENVGGKYHNVTHYLEKKEDVFVLTKEELQEVWYAAQEIHKDACPNDCVPKYQTMDDFLNQQT